MAAGRRDKKISLQRYEASPDDSGQEVQAWSEFAKEWAEVFWGRGDERRQAAMEQGSQAATFQMLSNSRTRDLKIADRIVMDDDAFDIVGLSPDTPRRGLIEATATRAL